MTTRQSYDNEGENMARPHFEPRSIADTRDRAIVIDAAVAKTILWLVGGSLATFLTIGLWIGTTVQRFDGRIGSLEKAPILQDAQLAAISAMDVEQNRRLTALEIAATGISALKERMDLGFKDTARRLDKLDK